MKTKKHINLIALGASFIFIFNPNINIIDVLPDFIGYIILCVALTPLADLNEYMEEALSGFKRMIFIDAAKILAYMWVFGISVTGEYNSSLMLWSFIFGIVELIFLLPAYVNLFKGFTGLGYSHENTAILGSRRSGGKSYTDKMRGFTLFFIAFKSVMSFLPELSDLTSTEYYENSGMTNLYRYIGVMRLLAFVPVLIFGIVWLIKITRYLRRIRMDKEFCESLERDYEKRVLPKNGIFVKRNVSIAFSIMITAAILSLDLRIEKVNIFPDFIFGALMIAFFVLIAKKTLLNKSFGVIMSVAYILTSGAFYAIEIFFFKNYSYGAAQREVDAFRCYNVMTVAGIVNAVVFVLLCFAVIKALSKVIDAHTGYVLTEKTANTEMQSRIAEATRKEIKKQLFFCAVVTVIYAIADVCYLIFAKEYGFMFLINIACCAIFVGAYLKTAMDVYEAISTKYMLE